MSIRGIAGTYEIEVLLGTQEVCLLDLDLPDGKSELRKLKLDTPSGEESFRGLLAGSFSAAGDDDSTRQIQIYDLMDGISTLREAIEEGETADKLKTRFANLAKDEISQGCLQYFFYLIEPLSSDKTVQLLSQFSKFLFTKKESLPKATSQTKQAKEAPRWDRVVKQNVLITDEPTQDIDVNPLEEEPVETDALETDWHDTGVDTEPIGDSDAHHDDADDDISDIP